MGNLIEIVDSLEDKIERLLQKYEVLNKKNRTLEDDLKLSLQNNAQLQQEIETLEDRNQSLKAANAILGSNDHKRETKLKINSLIREIDQCIVQLSE
ncbi:MAG TPA: hypothetical protein VFM65_02810 [Flavobacteriaceae bacterium]|nr:hypothetical protein [Flavobacteriaceae bacterium]